MLLRRLAAFTHRRRWPVLVAFALLLGGAAAYAIAGRDMTSEGFDVMNGESARASRVLEERFGVRSPVVVAYSHASAAFPDRAIAGPLRTVTEALAQDPAVRNVSSPLEASGRALVSEDRRVVLLTFELAGGEAARTRALERLLPVLRVEGLTTRIGGALAAERETRRAAARDLERSQWITLPLVAVLLIVFFRGFAAAMFPVLIGGLAIAGAITCVRLLAHVTQMSMFATHIVAFLGLGVAVDYSLFVTSRFREELASGRSVASALEQTLTTAGRTVAYSGIVVAVSLLGLAVFPIVLLRSLAISGALVVSMALVSTLVFLPAGLSALGHRVDRARRPRRARARRASQWRRLAELVMRRPALFAASTIALLLLFGSPFLRFHPATGGASVLPRGSEGRAVAELLESGRFPSSEVAPVGLVLDTAGPVLTSTGLRAVERYAARVAALPGVERVDSIVGATGARTPAHVLALARSSPEIAQLAQGDITVLRILTRAPPGSDARMTLVERIREIAVDGVDDALVSGQAASRLDLRDAIEARLPFALAWIVTATFVVLFLAFGSVVVPLKAIVLNVLSLTAAFGALVAIFQEGRLERVLGFESTGTIQLAVPVAMFAVLFGLAMDYELFLLSRIREEHDRTGDTRASVSAGMERSGTIITRAALLLIAVMLGFIAADLILIKQLGVGMAVAIAVDVTIVRGVLVPAAMKLLGRWNWWAPRRLGEWSRRLRIGIESPEGPTLHG